MPETSSNIDRQYPARLVTVSGGFSSTLAPSKYFESAEDTADSFTFPDEEVDDDVEDTEGNEEDLDEMNDDLEDFEKDTVRSTFIISVGIAPNFNFAASDVQNIDNQLSPELLFPSNKLERLARECSHQNFKLPCRSGQKWYCQHEHGRWRKHKCKSQISFPKQKPYRKCACFSAEKLVYKKLPVSILTNT